jgi:hypothetical protein
LDLQFGSTFADTAKGRHRFREDFTKHLTEILVVYPAAKGEVTPVGLVLMLSPTHEQRRWTQRPNRPSLPLSG